MALHQRLLRDISELTNYPYPDITFVPCEEDLRYGCLLLTPNGGRQLHLTVQFPEDYPLRPPTITIQSQIAHPNVYGSYICASILNTREGYTPAYTLKGIFIQILSFFASDSLDQDWGPARDLTSTRLPEWYTAQKAGNYYCEYCSPHLQTIELTTTSSASPQRGNLLDINAWPLPGQSSALMPVPSVDKAPSNSLQLRCQLSSLPDEILLRICQHLETEDLNLFSWAWDRIGGNAGLVQKFNIVRDRELICFCLKKHYTECQLGIGVKRRYAGRISSLESEFDLLSLEAYQDFNVNRSVQGIVFDTWLPLALSRRHHMSIEPLIEPRFRHLAKCSGYGSDTKPQTIIYAFMTDIVIRLCEKTTEIFQDNSSSLLHASEKAIESYYHLYHLLLCLACSDQTLTRTADSQVSSFLTGDTNKTIVPNLGHLLLMTLISKRPMTKELLKAIVRETITRNIVWTLDGRAANHQELAYLEHPESPSPYRLQTTFSASIKSYRLLMFLTLFRRTINRGTTPLLVLRDALFDSHGAPPPGTAYFLAQGIKHIQTINTFPSFLRFLKLDVPSELTFSKVLRESVEESMKKRYSVWAITQASALSLRRKQDPNVVLREAKDVNPVWDRWAKGNKVPGKYTSFFPREGRKKS